MAKQSPALIKWVYTWNNYPEGTQLDWIDSELVSWHVAQFERASTPHIQGVVHFLTRKRLTALKKDFPIELHWEPQRGSNDQARIYCTKEDTREPDTQPHIFGEPSVEHNDIPSILLDLAISGDFGEIKDRSPIMWIRHRNTFINARNDFATKLTNLAVIDNHWIYGDTRAGKSYYARNHWRADDTYTLKSPYKWWPNYRGESTVHIEDLDLSHTGMLALLKDWGDSYPFPIESKGTISTIRPLRIVITSNHSIKMFDWRSADKDAIYARYTEKRFTIEDREVD